MAQRLKKYKLKNAEGITRITLGTETFYLDSLTDEQAEVIFRGGQSNYIELVPEEETPAKKKKSE